MSNKKGLNANRQLSPEQQARRNKRKAQATKIQQGIRNAAREVWNENKDTLKEVGKQIGASVIRAIIKQNPEGWYVKYGKITPAVNTSRPMDAIFNTSITRSGTMGSYPKFVDVNISWGEFFNSHAFNLIVEKAMQDLRSDLRSNLPYGIDALRRYIANSITLGCIAKQFERDVLWSQFTSSSMRDFVEAWKTSIQPYDIDYNGLVNTIHHSYLDTDQWPSTIAMYEQIAFQVGTNIKLPPSLMAFIDHYFANVFVSEPQVDKAQVMRLRINEMPLILSDNTTQIINIIDLSAGDLFNLLRDHIIESSIIIADLEKSSNIRGLTLRNYENREYNFVYDETFLQAIENGYTSPSAVTEKGFVRMDARYTAADPYTQFLFMGGVQNWFQSSATAYVPAFTMMGMTIKIPTTSEVEWPLSLCGERNVADDLDVPYSVNADKGTFTTNADSGISIIAFNFTTDVSSSVELSANYQVSSANQYVISSTANVSNPLSNAFVSRLSMHLPSGSHTTTLTESQNGTYYSEGYDNLHVGTTDIGVAALISSVGRWALYMFVRAEITQSTFDRFALTGVQDLDSIVLVNNPNNGIFPGLIVGAIAAGTDDSPAPYFEQAGLDVVRDIDASSVRWSMRVDNLVAYYKADRKGLDIRSAYVTYGGNSSWNAIFTTFDSDTPAVAQVDGNIGFGGSRSDWYFIDNVVGIISYSQPVAVGLEGTTNYVAGPVGLAGYIADNLDIHIPVVYKPSISILVNVSTPGGNGITQKRLAGCPILIKESSNSYYYNILDLEPVLYKMFSSLFSLEKSERNIAKNNK